MNITDKVNPQARLVMAVLALLIAMAFMLQYSPISMIFLALTLVLIWDFFRNSSVWIAFRAFRRGDSMVIGYLLRQVVWPRLLSKESQSYYYWMLGVSCLTQTNWQEAKLYLLMAAAGTIRTENDRALIQCTLAEVTLQLGARQEALRHLLMAAQLQHYESVDKIIEELQLRIGSSGDSD